MFPHLKDEFQFKPDDTRVGGGAKFPCLIPCDCGEAASEHPSVICLRLYDKTEERPASNYPAAKIVLSTLSPEALATVPTGNPHQILEACRKTLLAANKGVAHFTDQDRGRSQAKDARLCALTILWHIEEHVYGRKGIAVPHYRVWTAA